MAFALLFYPHQLGLDLLILRRQSEVDDLVKEREWR
jgi:hypothetical protein